MEDLAEKIKKYENLPIKEQREVFDYLSNANKAINALFKNDNKIKEKRRGDKATH